MIHGHKNILDNSSSRTSLTDPSVPAGPKTQVEITPSIMDVEIELMPDAPQKRHVTIP